MNENNWKQKQAHKQKQRQKQDLAARRILAVFLMAALVLWGMSFLYETMTFGTTFMQGQIANNALMAVSAVAFVVLLIVYFTAKKRGTLRTDRVLNSGFFALCALAVCVSSCILALDYYNGMHILYVLLPVGAVLYLVYYVYERQFFTFCVASAASIGGAWCCYAGARERLPMLVLAAVLCLIPVALALLGKGRLQALTEQVLGRQFDLRYTLAAYLGMLLLVAAAALLGGKVALIAALFLGIYLLASAVYYTIKAM